MITFSMVQSVHIESFLALESATAKAKYVARLAGSWTFKDKSGQRIPLGDVTNLSKQQQAELVEAFKKQFVDGLDQPPKKSGKKGNNESLDNDPVQDAEV